MVVALDLQCDRQPVADIHDARVLAGSLQHALPAGGEAGEETPGVLGSAVLAPHQGVDGQLHVGGFRPLYLPDLLVLATAKTQLLVEFRHLGSPALPAPWFLPAPVGSPVHSWGCHATRVGSGRPSTRKCPADGSAGSYCGSRSADRRCRSLFENVIDERAEDAAAVGPAQFGFAHPLRVGHHPQDIARLVNNARDVVHRAVGVGAVGDVSPLVAVAKNHQALLLDLAKTLRAGGPIALVVVDRDLDDLAHLEPPRERRVVTLHLQILRMADELEPPVLQQRAMHQVRLSKDLKSVADTQHRASRAGKLRHFLHDGTEARNGPRPQIVAVRKTTWEHHDVGSVQVVILMPQIVRRGVRKGGEGVVGVVLAVGTGKNHDPKIDRTPGGLCPWFSGGGPADSLRRHSLPASRSSLATSSFPEAKGSAAVQGLAACSPALRGGLSSDVITPSLPFSKSSLPSASASVSSWPDA